MQLLVQSGPEAGKLFSLSTTPQVAGRQLGAEILLNDEQVSRRHVSFQEVNGTLLVTDLGSANGTQLNGQRLIPNQPQPLSPGDQVKIGSTVLVVQTSAGSAYNQPPGWTGNDPASYSPGPVSPVQSPFYAPTPAQPLPPSYQPATSSEMAPGFNQPSPPVNPNFSAPGYVGQNFGPGGYNNNYGLAPAPPLAPANKKRGGLFAGLGAITLLAVAAIVGIILIGGNNNPPKPNQPAGLSSTVVPRTPATGPVGPSGSNPPPPPPPAGVRGLPNPASSPEAARYALPSPIMVFKVSGEN